MQAETLYKGHLLESETYIGGKVEALESGVFRSDLPTRFKCKREAYQGLIDCLDRDLSYALTHEARWDMADVANYDEVKAEITQMLEALREAPNRCAIVVVAAAESFAMPAHANHACWLKSKSREAATALPLRQRGVLTNLHFCC